MRRKNSKELGSKKDLVVAIQAAKRSTENRLRSCKEFANSKKTSQSRVTGKVKVNAKAGQTTILAKDGVKVVETFQIFALLDRERTLDKM